MPVEYMMPLFHKDDYAAYADYVKTCVLTREPVGPSLFCVYAEYPGGGAGVCPHCGNTLLIEARTAGKLCALRTRRTHTRRLIQPACSAVMRNYGC